MLRDFGPLFFFSFLMKFNLGIITMNKSAFSLALESADGKTRIEDELTIYVLVNDIHDIKSLATETEEHEQWKLKLGEDKVSARIRLTDKVDYEFTIKEKTKFRTANHETSQPITEDTFEALRRQAYDGRKKTRYVIPIEGSDRKWEVDVFKTPAGDTSLWVKVDYEFNGKGSSKLPEIPFPYTEIIIPDLEEGREADVERLWKEEWMKLDNED